MVQNATEESVKNEIPSKEDEMLVYDNFPEEEEEVTQEVVEEDVGIPDAAATEDSEDELVYIESFYLNLLVARRRVTLMVVFAFLLQNFGKVAAIYK